MKTDALYQRIVLDHAKHRRNNRVMNDCTHFINYRNPTCGDYMTLYVKIDGERIADLSFDGEGCFISMASCSMFTVIGKGRTIEELTGLTAIFSRMVLNGAEPDTDRLEDAISLRGVHSFPSRHNCALMPFQAFERLKQEME